MNNKNNKDFFDTLPEKPLLMLFTVVLTVSSAFATIWFLKALIN